MFNSKNMDLVKDYYKYINKKVLLKTIKCSHLGVLKCIDPKTQTIALIVNDIESNLSKLVLVMSHSIKSIELIDENNDDNNTDDLIINLNQFLSTSMGEHFEKSFSEQQLQQRKSDVINWLKVNHIPVQEADNGSLLIAFALTLNKPYFKEQCICGNEIVLGKIQSLLDSMPQKTQLNT
jgi:hypothetical protein